MSVVHCRQPSERLWGQESHPSRVLCYKSGWIYGQWASEWVLVPAEGRSLRRCYRCTTLALELPGLRAVLLGEPWPFARGGATVGWAS